MVLIHRANGGDMKDRVRCRKERNPCIITLQQQQQQPLRQPSLRRLSPQRPCSRRRMDRLNRSPEMPSCRETPTTNETTKTTHWIERIFITVLVKRVPRRSVIVPSRTRVTHRGTHRADYTDKSSPSGSGRILSRKNRLFRLI